MYSSQKFLREKINEEDKNSAVTTCSSNSYQSTYENYEPLYELPMRKRRSTNDKKKFTIKHFKLLKHLGKGRFGEVFLAVYVIC